ncbi:hypothetical protein [Dongshaea marina]|uniref:hypothetical protein n=1 Tax=Dongshaea marina TaxID=2047966 RepID=UPI000D3E48DD|nr:hypothetical protein [Dongshaea marina]
MQELLIELKTFCKNLEKRWDHSNHTPIKYCQAQNTLNQSYQRLLQDPRTSEIEQRAAYSATLVSQMIYSQLVTITHLLAEQAHSEDKPEISSEIEAVVQKIDDYLEDAPPEFDAEQFEEITPLANSKSHAESRLLTQQLHLLKQRLSYLQELKQEL